MADDKSSGADDSRVAWREALRTFDDWVDADAPRQATLIAALAAHDAAAHAHLLELIAADRAAEGRHFLAADAIGDAQPLGEDSAPSDLAGERIGAWRLDMLLGAGGSGQVWLATRCDGLHAGHAAIKLLRGAASDRQAQQRFAREGRLLARLQHPHIARLLDVGDGAQGQRYLVLEHIDGERIDHWCDRQSANIEARLHLFLQVCDAVAYAHANLIVHRDLKPSNILVGADGEAKLLDFGIAKLLDADIDIDEAGELTRAGGAAFTPEYAAPEQFSGEPATVATDVYSLGIVLYLLLSGRRPYGEGNATPMQWAQTIATREPRRLSQAAVDKGDDTERHARVRAATPEQLRRRLRGDLETILARALKKAPGERYATVQAFADDVRRYLRHQPIRARADSAGYRLRKFVRRHRLGVAMSALAVLGVVIGAASVLRAEHVAVREAARAQAVQQFLIGLFQEADPAHAQGEKRTVGDLLDRGEKNLLANLDDAPQTKLALLAALGNIRDRLGDGRRATALAQTALDLAVREYGADSIETGDAQANLADAQKSASDFAPAEKNYLQARTILERYAGQRAPMLARLASSLAFVYLQTDRDAQALAQYTAAMPQIEKLFGAQSWEAANQKSLLADLYAKLGRHADAAALYASLDPLLDSAPPEHALAAAEIRGNQGYTLMKLGRTAECETVLRKAVIEYDRLAGPDNNYAVAALRTLGYAQAEAGEYAKAMATFDDLVARTRRAFGVATGEYALNESFRIGPMLMTGRIGEATTTMRTALDIARSASGLTPAELRSIERRYALTLIWDGNAREAGDLLDKMLTYERENKEPAFKLASTLMYLAGAQSALGRFAAARASAHEAAGIYARLNRRNDAGSVQLTEALAVSGQGFGAEALGLVDAAEANLMTRFAADSPRLLLARVVRAQILRAAGRESEAAAIDAAARAMLQRDVGAQLPSVLVMVF
ncbi:MAG: serine/threonine protein kinase [Proteobacteria bacterium]|nr:serine/threonine protein kinase [Pseudomonadota bacterium]